MPMDQAEFDHRRGMLLMSINSVYGAFISAFPDGYIYDPDGHYYSDNPLVAKLNGSAGEHPMHGIADKISDVMATFDMLQEGLGLPRGEEPRYRRFLEGGYNQP